MLSYPGPLDPLDEQNNRLGLTARMYLVRQTKDNEVLRDKPEEASSRCLRSGPRARLMSFCVRITN